MAFEMRLTGLELRNFRKFERYSIDFDGGMTVLVGANGSGKSSVLDAARVALGAFTSLIHSNSRCAISQSDARICRYEMVGVTDWQGQYPVVVSAKGLAGDNSADTVTWSRALDSSDDNGASFQVDGMRSLARTCSDRVKSGDEKLVLPIIAYYGTGRLWARFPMAK